MMMSDAADLLVSCLRTELWHRFWRPAETLFDEPVSVETPDGRRLQIKHVEEARPMGVRVLADLDGREVVAILSAEAAERPSGQQALFGDTPSSPLGVVEYDYSQPGNEIEEHFFLKMSARNYLHHHYAYAVASEVTFVEWRDKERYRQEWEEQGAEGIMARVERAREKTGKPDAGSAWLRCRLWPVSRAIDVVGVSPRHYALGRQKQHSLREAVGRELLSIGVEVKVSRGGFLSGYHERACNLNYLATPPGLVEVDEVPDHVGLLTYSPRCDGNLRMRRRAEELPSAEVPLPARAAMKAVAFRLTSEWHYKARRAVDDPFARADEEADVHAN